MCCAIAAAQSAITAATAHIPARVGLAGAAGGAGCVDCSAAGRQVSSTLVCSTRLTTDSSYFLVWSASGWHMSIRFETLSTLQAREHRAAAAMACRSQAVGTCVFIDRRPGTVLCQ